MKLTEQYPVYFNRQYFCGIKKFDCDVIHLFTEPTLSGTYFTSFAISPLEFREKYNFNRASVSIEENSEYTSFHITADCGSIKVVYILNTLKDQIDSAKKSAIDLGLMKDVR